MAQEIYQHLHQIAMYLGDLADERYGEIGPRYAQDLDKMLHSVQRMQDMLHSPDGMPMPLEQLQGLGHDLRGALNIVIGHSTILSTYPDLYPGESLNAAQIEWLQRVCDICRPLLIAINSVVFYAKIKTGKLRDITCKPVDAVSTVQSVIYEQAMSANMDDVFLNLDPNTPHVYAEPARLQHAIEMLWLLVAEWSDTHDVRVHLQAVTPGCVHMTVTMASQAVLQQAVMPLTKSDWTADLMDTPSWVYGIYIATAFLRSFNGDLLVSTQGDDLALNLQLPVVVG